MSSLGQFLVAALALPLVACAHQEQVPPPQDRVVLAVATPPPAPPMPDGAFQSDAPASRPRLTKTVTLGQSEDGYVQPAQAAPQPGGPTVVVNNNVYVYGGAPPVYGGYYYGGYGGYGGNHGTWSQGSGNSFGGYSSTGPRTAPAGHTPGVGGNWSPAPSYGPRPMR